LLLRHHRHQQHIIAKHKTQQRLIQFRLDAALQKLASLEGMDSACNALEKQLQGQERVMIQLRRGHEIKGESLALLAERCHQLRDENVELRRLLGHDGWKAVRNRHRSCEGLPGYD
jgi:hypothetical protein